VRRGKEIEAEFYNFRAELDGRPVTDNEIIAILRTERHPQRRRAVWEASKQIGPRVADRLVELVKRRNAAARTLGYRDYYALQLHLQQIDEPELLGLFHELKALTDRPFQRAKTELDRRIARRFRVRPEALKPWHYEDPFFQEPPLSSELGLAPFFRNADLVGIAERFFAGVGLPVGDVLERSDLEERPGKDQHAYCTHIDREGDVRVLCNLKANDRWMGILLHELGHAAYDKFIPRDLAWTLRQPPHTATTEAIAMFMDRLPYDLDWVVAVTGRRPSDGDGLADRLTNALRFEMLLMARWVPVMTLFERALYAAPESNDLAGLWWDLVEEYQRVPRPEGRSAPDWAAKIHLTVAPVYYHNYLLGELIASQLKAALDRELGDGNARGYVGRPELGDFLRARVFAPGARLHWQEHLRRATGAPLGIAAFAQHFVGSGA
jgi:peptidyl-dipeptidase A